ncbi:HNH endonuclease family protein [Streptomyces halobius]|uniref:HNH endonuclease family protein n=1 Tax=Streptomyces halobius TaxID=2879846 RepID=A0ABY4LZH9_9ACTN|nr:HNH endonuclease family protein [Streptomyces halobius]UQA90906.1 HNH endonuclease family protein [Streptomyces halobius]
MSSSHWWRRVVATAASLALIGLTASTSAAATTAETTAETAASHLTPPDLPEPSPVGVARTELAGLRVEAPHSMDGYSRAKFPHWIKQEGECDTRETVLARDGEDVQQDDMCRAISGSWFSEYDSEWLTSSRQLDIDHIVPLANAWRSGADEWTTQQRKSFANDLTDPQLIAVSASSNRQKGDKSPDQWAPRYAYWCTYARAWIDVKHLYELNVTRPESAMLADMLDTCDQ